MFNAWRERLETRRPKTRTTPRLEGLEERTVPSAVSGNTFSAEAVASPSSASSAAVFISFADRAMDQEGRLIATLSQNAFGAVQTLDRWYAQELSYFGQQLNRVLGINPYASNSALSTNISQSGNDSGSGRGNSSGSGSGKGTMTTSQNTTSQTLNSTTQQSGRGSGSGSGTMNRITVSKQGLSPVHPLTGSGSAGSNGSGTGFIGNGQGSGPANVYGQVWLDNNGDGSINNGEMGFQGITVQLINPATGSVYQSQVTKAGGGYAFTITEPPPPGHTYAVQVILSSVPYRDFYATLRGPGVSQINAHGTSASFNVANGGWRQIEAGICSMDVTTTDDDPNEVLDPNQVTLRDAIETGNNGGGLNQLLNEEPVRFINPLNGQALTGTITLQKALDPISKSYDIDGPGANDLTISAQASANNPFRVFYVNAGVTTTISGLTIKSGYLTGGGSGAGVDNYGDTYLVGDVIASNTIGDNFGVGGGVYNASSGQLWLSSTTVSGNSANKGGGVYNTGRLTLCCGSSITSNQANYGGGLYNDAGGKVGIQTKSSITSNQASMYGGGVYNDAGFSSMSSGTIAQNTAGVSGGGIYNNVGSISLTNFTIGSQNLAQDQGGGMYLAKNSTTNFDGPTTVNGNRAAGAGSRVYQQNNAKINFPGSLTDNDDPGGKPVTGP